MLRPHAQPETLAHWRYTPDEWRAFTGHERDVHRFELSDLLTKHLHLIVIIAVVFVVGGGAAGGVGGAVIVAVMGGVFFLLVTLFHKAMRMYAQSSLEARPGEVYITHNGVWTNGMWFGWGARDPAWRLRVVRRETVPVETGATMDVLEFKCVGTVPLRGGKVPIDKGWRVPVPAGKKAEADAIVTRLLGAQHGAGAESNLYGHDFAAGVCRRCGSTVEAVLSFKWGCKEQVVWPGHAGVFERTIAVCC